MLATLAPLLDAIIPSPRVFIANGAVAPPIGFVKVRGRPAGGIKLLQFEISPSIAGILLIHAPAVLTDDTILELDI